MPVPTPSFADHPDHARAIREAVLRAADPARALEAHWPGDLSRVRLLAIGKAAVPMGSAARRLLAASGATLGAALIVTTPHPDAAPPAQGDNIELLTADHPLATPRNLAAAARVAEFVSRTDPGATLLVLLSGGGSALLTWPAEGLTLDDLRDATTALLRAGAPISELNCVRKHCERLKGGRLARLVPPGVRTIALVVSDVLGDPLDVISSGPFFPDPTTYADALGVLERRGLARRLVPVAAHLARGAAGGHDETPKPGDPALARVSPRVIAGNQQAALAARDAVLALGFGRAKVVFRVEGEASQAGRNLAREALAYASEAGGHSSRPAGAAGPRRGAAVIYAGETTVTVGSAPGVGGRNQELALAAAIELGALDSGAGPRSARVAVLTLATDGLDGPTDAAGAVVSSQTGAEARERAVLLEDALARHDSHTALDALGCLVRTGPTGTNVNDVAVALVYP